MNPVAGWRSTVLGVLMFVGVVLQPLIDFFQSGQPITPVTIVGLISTVYLAFVARR